MSKQLVLDAVVTGAFIDTAPVYKRVKGGYVEVKNQAVRGIKRANLKRTAPTADKLVKGIHLFVTGLYGLFRAISWLIMMVLLGINHGFRWVLREKD